MKIWKGLAIVLLIAALCVAIPVIVESNTYYVVRTTFEDEKSQVGRFDSLDEARDCANEHILYGYRVFNNHGAAVYAPYSDLVTDILREGKYVTDYVRENFFLYGDAPINPGMDCSAGIVSCDRLVCWVLYRVGYTDQPRQGGIVVYDGINPERDFPSWCESHGFIRIDSVEELMPGDIVFVNPKTTSSGTVYPGHTFLVAGFGQNKGEYYRYDCGSDARIQSVQPTLEPVPNFMFAYRAV